MPKRYFNWKLAAILLIGLVVLGVTAYGLRRWRRSTRADRGLVLGNKAYDEHNWEEATTNLGRYLAVVQDDMPALLKYADAQLNIRPLKRNNVQQAVAAYRTVLRIDKNNSEAAMQLTEMYLGMGMPGEAELIATRALQTNRSPELRRMLAVALANQRKFKEAAKELKSIIKEHPEQILAYDILGQLIEQRPEHFSQAPQFWFNEAVKNNPSSALAYIIRAGFYLRRKDRLKALADLEQAEKLELSDPVARLRLAKAFINANILGKAEQHLAAVQMAESASQALWRIWAQLALKSQSKTKMLKVAESGLKELSSQSWDFMPQACELFIRCGKFDRAGDCLDKLKQKDIAPAAVAFLEGLLAAAEQQNHKAISSWRKAKQLGDKSEKTQLALAKAYSRAGDNQSAILQLRTLVSEQPNLFQGHLDLARLLCQTGNWAQAVEQARLAMQIVPENIEAVLLHIQARLKLIETNKTSTKEQIWQKIEKKLTDLENVTGGAPEVKLLQFQLAMQCRQFANAEQLLMNLKADEKPRLEVAIAHVDLLTAQGEVDKAVSKLYVLTEQFPQAVLPVKYLAGLLAKHRSKEECEKVLKDAMQRIEDPVAKRDLGILLAHFYNQWDQNDKSYQMLTALSQELPYDIPVKRQLLKCEQVAKDVDHAQQLVDDVKAVEGEDGRQWRYEQAKVWFGADDFKNQYPEIISLLKENLLANPDDQASRMLLAAAYEQAGELWLAISTYNEALNHSPRDIRIIVPAVAALYKAEEYGRADEILRRAANEKLFHPELKKLELQSHLRRGELSSASDILENLLTDDPNNRSVCLSLALLNMRQNKFAEADELLTKLKIQDPNSLPVTVAQIESNVRQGKSDEALLLCDEVVSTFNNATAYILRARTFVSLGQAERAKKDFEHATIIEPNNVAAWTAQSDFYRSTGQLNIALTDIRKAISIAPDNLAIQKRAISLLLASGDRNTIREGNNILDKTLTSNPKDIELRLYKARSLLAEGRAPAIEQAAGILQKVTEDQPKISEAWELLGEISLGQGESGKAMDIALRGLAYKLNDKGLLLLKARAEAIRSPVLAVPTLKMLRELDPNDADTAVLLASTYSAAGEPEKAVNLLKTQLASCRGTPDERKVNIALAAALHKNGNKPEAQEIFDSLYQSAPDDPTPLLAQARLLKEDKLWDRLSQMVTDWCRKHPRDTHTPITIADDLAAAESSEAKKTAEDLLRGVLDSNPNSLPALNTLAMLLQMTDQSSESTKLYWQILELEPDNVIVMNNLAWILCEEQGQFQQALELAQRGLEKAPNYTDLIDTRGVVYYKLSQYEKAVQDFTRCLKLYPDGTPSVVASYLHLGKALANLGQKNEAVESFKKALELNNKIGGLSTADFAEARRLLEELSQGV